MLRARAVARSWQRPFRVRARRAAHQEPRGRKGRNPGPTARCFPVLAFPVLVSGWPFGGSKRTVPLAPERRQGPPVARAGTDAQRLEERADGPPHADRCQPPRRDPGGRCRWNEADRVRFRDRVSQASERQHLPRQGHPHRAVAAGGVRRIWRQPPRLPGFLGNPSRLLPDPGRRPRAAAGRAAGAG